jgi:hypothetical protein
MPGTFVIDTRETFDSALLMASGPKMQFQTTEQDVSATGERKWEILAVLTWKAEPGRNPVVEVVKVTMLGGTNPADGIAPGTMVELGGFRVGISTPEKTDRGGVRGGKPWYQATAIRPLVPAGRKPE